MFTCVCVLWAACVCLSLRLSVEWDCLSLLLSYSLTEGQRAACGSRQGNTNGLNALWTSFWGVCVCVRCHDTLISSLWSRFLNMWEDAAFHKHTTDSQIQQNRLMFQQNSSLITQMSFIRLLLPDQIESCVGLLTRQVISLICTFHKAICFVRWGCSLRGLMSSWLPLTPWSPRLQKHRSTFSHRHYLYLQTTYLKSKQQQQQKKLFKLHYLTKQQ